MMLFRRCLWIDTKCPHDFQHKMSWFISYVGPMHSQLFSMWHVLLWACYTCVLQCLHHSAEALVGARTSMPLENYFPLHFLVRVLVNMLIETQHIRVNKCWTTATFIKKHCNRDSSTSVCTLRHPRQCLETFLSTTLRPSCRLCNSVMRSCTNAYIRGPLQSDSLRFVP